MITFLELGNHGRLGNQLFQYATLRAIALENNYVCKIPDPRGCEWHGQQGLLGEFNIEAEYLTSDDVKKLEYRVLEPSHHHYYEQLWKIPDNTDIHGFFQSTYYFDKYKEQIRGELTPKAKYMTQAEEYLNTLRQEGQEVVSVHLRRGDTTDGTNPSYLSFYGKDDIFDMTSIYGAYLSKALKKFENKNVVYLVFTGGSRTGDDTADILWAKRNFDREGWHVSETNDPMQDFALIASCDHHIVCHLTTFGWWAAYLKGHPDKIVVAPKNYFYDEADDYRRSGFFPDYWEMV